MTQPLTAMRWTLGKKILIAFALPALAMLAVGMVAYRSAADLSTALAQRREGSEIRYQISELVSTLADAETGQRGFVITGDERYLEPYTTGVNESGEHMARLRELVRNYPDQQKRLNAVEPLIHEKFAELAQSVEARRKSGAEAAAELVRTDRGRTLMEQIRRLGDDLQAEAQRLLDLRTESAEKSVMLAKTTTTVGTAVVFLLLALAGLFVTRNIVRPLREMTSAAERIAAGDLTVSLPASGRSDEVEALRRAFSRMVFALREMAVTASRIAAGDLTAAAHAQSPQDELGAAFATMATNLRSAMQDVQEAVNVLSSSAGEISVSITQVAASASQTAAAVAETTATVEQVKQIAKLSSERMRSVSDTAQHASRIAEDGRRSVEATTEGMNRIREQMDNVAGSMNRLSEQTMAIGDIIASVNELAEQLNILAVNASIEAAKAGEQGRGFSVVAHEVRSLAEQSKRATAQVRSILTDIQKAASAAAQATEQGSRAVDAGLQQSSQAGASIASLAGVIAQSSQAAMHIAASSQEQTAGTDQVAIAMRSIHEASSQNAAVVKQIETTARDLGGIGRKLKDLVGRYKV